MSKMARRKGHSFEREVAILLRKYFPEAKRHLEYQACEAKGIDLDNTGILRVQCKRGRKYASITAIEEVQIDPIEGGIPLLVTKGDGKPIVACLYLEDLLRIIKL